MLVLSLCCTLAHVCPGVVLMRHDLLDESATRLSEPNQLTKGWLKEEKVGIRELREGSSRSTPK